MCHDSSCCNPWKLKRLAASDRSEAEFIHRHGAHPSIRRRGRLKGPDVVVYAHAETTEEPVKMDVAAAHRLLDCRRYISNRMA